MSKLIPKVKLHFKLPTRYNDNTRIDAEEFVNVKAYFMNTYDGYYYTYEEYEEIWHTKSNTCYIESGSTLVLYNENQNTIRINEYIQN